MGSANQYLPQAGSGFSATELHDQGQETRPLLMGRMGSSSRKALGPASRAGHCHGVGSGGLPRGLPWVQAERADVGESCGQAAMFEEESGQASLGCGGGVKEGLPPPRGTSIWKTLGGACGLLWGPLAETAHFVTDRVTPAFDIPTPCHPPQPGRLCDLGQVTSPL